MHKHDHYILHLLLPFLLIHSSFNVSLAGDLPAGESPFTPKAYLIRYYKKQVSNDKQKPWFLLNKASPLSAVDAVAFANLAANNSLSGHLSSFCSAAHLFCFPDIGASLEKHDHDVNFASYLDYEPQDVNFTNYGTSAAGGVDSFKNYSDGKNIANNDFRRYSRDAAGHSEKFNNYAPDTNVVDQSFHTYGTSAAGGSGDFKNYNNQINVPGLHFTTYSDEGTGRTQTFTVYADQSNAGDETFISYGKNGNGASNTFSSYGNASNVMGSNFKNYGESGNGITDNFTSYAFDANVPENNFKNYGDGGNTAVETFISYRDQSNVGDDSFKSYAKNSNVGKVNFVNYGQSINGGTDNFTSYGKGATGQSVGFKIYGVNNTFADYAKKGVTFANYINGSSAQLADKKGVMNRWVEPGKFFREAMLKEGTIMPMPDIRDKMPDRSFLPRVIVSKLPFSTSKLTQLKEIFHASDNSSMAGILASAISECERKPSPGETKRCVGSVEDMIDFATSVLGRNVAARTSDNTQGSKQNILIGSVKGIEGGKITKSVSCHQSLYPYLLYYCHSVPKVRVYEADILDLKSNAKINHGVAICHVDTSSWSPTHGAFLALGSAPGKIEVCHWIFENDLAWTIAN